MMTDDLEREVPAPAGPVAQTILWQLNRISDELKHIGKAVDEVRLSVKGDRLNPGLEEISREHAKRLADLEGRLAWLAGIGTAVFVSALGYYVTRVVLTGGNP